MESKVKLYFILAGMLLACITNAHAETYRWLDKSGKVHYGDVPSEGATNVEVKNFGVAPAENDADLPYATRLAHQNFPVTLYTFSACNDPCKQARDFLNKRGIPFTEKNLSTNSELDEFKKNSGGNTVPTLSVGTSWLKNFEAGQWNSELDSAGYPKIAPYRPQTPPPPAPKNKPTDQQ